jgi:hypothetical protein
VLATTTTIGVHIQNLLHEQYFSQNPVVRKQMQLVVALNNENPI